MKKILTFIILGLGFAAASCTKADVSESKGEGMLSVDMSIASQTRAAVGEDELLNTAVVNIYKADFSGLVRSYTYSDIPSPMYLAADKYRVDVLAGEAVATTYIR